MKTFSIKPTEVRRAWYVIDASEISLGRLASAAAEILMGKDKVSFTPHVDGGDYVIVINSSLLKVTANKNKTKTYFRHSGFPGGIYKRTLAEQLEKDPGVVIQKAVKGMLPSNKLRSGRLQRLRVYPTAEHNHSAQKPVIISLKKGS